jgi:hypothetical protein
LFVTLGTEIYKDMDKSIIKPYNVIDQTHLPEISVDQLPTDGDPIEIKGEMYYVCETDISQKFDSPTIGVIPLVVRNPANVSNIETYIRCLSIAHRKVIFKNASGICGLENCDEMIIT